jgi:CheY-like chemotaxis protein
VQSVREAWLKIREERFDLLMLDVWMPRVSGFEFSRQLREAGCTTPILFYSGAAGEPYQRNAFAAGGNAYVTKPDIQCLVDTVLTLIVAAETGSLPASHFKHEPHPANNLLSNTVHASIDESPLAE